MGLVMHYSVDNGYVYSNKAATNRPGKIRGE
jgi:hypothetical protein